MAGGGLHEARGRREIADAATQVWEVGRLYVAHPSQVVQARNTALVLGDGATNVVHRGSNDGLWRYAIALLEFQGR